MNKLILFALTVVAILFGGKLGLEYYYGKKLDELISHASIVADVNYQNVKIGTDGSIAINNLSVQPHAVSTLIRMSQIRLFSSDRLLPVNLTTFIKRAEFPNELGVRITNMEYDPLVFESAINENDKCRYIETTMRAELTGINRLNANIETSINVNSNNGVINISSSDQMAEMVLTASFDASLLNQARQSSSAQPFDEITLRYKLDEQVSSNLIETCSSQLGMNADEYLNNVVGSPNYLKSTGADFGPDAGQAIVDVYQGGKWLSIKSNPSSQLNNLNTLNLYQAKDIARLLGLKVSVDSQEVTLNISELPAASIIDDTSLDNVDESQANQISEAQIEVMSQLTTEEQQRIKLKLQEAANTTQKEYSYKVTPISSLNRYLRYSLILIRDGDKKPMSGELIAIEDDFFTIETGQYGGKAQFNIPIADVVEAQVYR